MTGRIVTPNTADTGKQTMSTIAPTLAAFVLLLLPMALLVPKRFLCVREAFNTMKVKCIDRIAGQRSRK